MKLNTSMLKKQLSFLFLFFSGIIIAKTINADHLVYSTSAISEAHILTNVFEEANTLELFINNKSASNATTTSIENIQDTEPPTAPGSLTATTITDTTIRLEWEASTDNVALNNYLLYQDGVAIIWSSSGTIFVNVGEGISSPLSPNTSYNFKLIAVDTSGNESPESLITVSTLPDTQAPTTPTNLLVTNVSGTTVSLQWDASTDSNGVTGYDLYQDATLLSSLTELNYTVTGLTPGTNYTYFVAAKDAAGNISENSESVNALTNSQIGYCPSTSSNTLEAYVSSVQLHTIDNTSDSQSYSDFTSLSTTLLEDQVYEITVMPTWTSSAFVQGYAVWIDYNNDQDFDDAGELVWSKAPDIDVVNTGYFTIPEGTINGPTRMRVSMKYNAIPTPCETFNDGEVEDYTVNLLALDTELPATPTALNATEITMSTFTLNWDASTDNDAVTGYNIYRDGNFQDTTTDTFYLAGNYLPNTSQDFGVQAIDNSGNLSEISTITVTTLPDTENPTAPTSLFAFLITDTSVNLSWNHASDNAAVVAYDIYLNGDFLVSQPSINRALDGLIPGTSYSIYVIAKDAAGNESPNSNTVVITTNDTIAPSSPTGFVGNQITNTSVNLSWNPATDNVGVVGYDIYSLGNFIISTTSTTHSFNGLTPNTSYSLTVRAKDAAGNESINSDTFNFSTLPNDDAQQPTIPTGVTASNIGDTALDLTWNASTDNVGVTGYDVYQNGSFLSTVPTASASISNLQPATVYSYYVVAKDAANNASISSGQISVLTTGNPPATYCENASTNISDEYISNVTLNTINNSSGAQFYSDFTAISTEVMRGSQATISVSPTWPDVIYDEGYAVWIDYNGDQDFDDAGELVWSKAPSKDVLNTGTFAIPNSASTGATRMRVILTYNVTPTSPCNSFVYGEVEDYTINIQGSDDELPTAPTNLTVTDVTDSTVTLQWDAASDNVGIADYDLYQDNTLVHTVSGTIITVTNLTPATSYSYHVRARDFAGNISEISTVVNVVTDPDVEPPTTPTSLTASNITGTSVALDWIAASDNIAVTSYDIYSNGAFLVSTSGIDYTVTGLSQITSYTFFVVARDANGNSSTNSNQITINTLDTEAPTIPQNLNATNINTNTLRLNWSASTDNSGGFINYDLYQDGILISSTSGTLRTISNLTPDTTYNFYIKSRDDFGNTSMASSTISVVTLSTVNCESASTNFSDEFISRVQLNTIDNTSGGSFYTDFTAISTNLFENQTYEMTITPTWTGTIYDEGYAVWIDYNGNNDFTDPGEKVIEIVATQDTPVSASFVVPELVAIGQVKMRVALRFFQTPIGPCDSFTYGEVEDYSIILNQEEFEAPTMPTALTASNITETSVDLSWNAATDNVGVVAYDVYQDNILVDSVEGLSTSISQLDLNTPYEFLVRARDGSGNLSPNSNVVTVFTLPDTDFPTPPTQLAFSNISETTVQLDWIEATDNIGVVAYTIYQDGNFLTTVTDNIYAVTNLLEGTNYSFYVVARDAAGNLSEASNTVTITTFETNPPTAPTALTASNITETTLFLDWNAATDDTGVVLYEVYQDGLLYGTTTGLIDNIDLLSPNTQYTFYVVAKDASGNASPSSNIVTIFTLPDTNAPQTPTELSATNITETTAQLNWIEATDNIGVIAYTIYQDGNFLTTVTDLSFEVTGLTQGAMYSFYVVARDAAGNTSENSNIVTFTTIDSLVPTTPTNLQATNITVNTVDLNWNASTDNSGNVDYLIYQDGTFITLVSGLSTTIVGLNPETTYTYHVRAIDPSGNASAISNVVEVTTDFDTPIVLHQGFFENTWDGWNNTEGNATRISTKYTYERRYAIQMKSARGKNTTIELNRLNLSTFENVHVDFYFYANEIGRNEGFTLEYWDGSIWSEVEAYRFGQNFFEENFHNVSVILDATAFTFSGNAKLRFVADSSSTLFEIYIDHVTVSANVPLDTLEGITVVEQGRTASAETAETQEIFAAMSVSIYPNPATAILNVKTTNYDGDFCYSIYNIVGQQIVTGTLENGSIELQNIPSGVYTLELINGSSTTVKRFIKE